MEEGTSLVLQTASVDALARLKSSSARCEQSVKNRSFDIYFEQQEHFSMIKFLSQCTTNHEKDGVMMQVSTVEPVAIRRPCVGSPSSESVLTQKNDLKFLVFFLILILVPDILSFLHL